MLVCLLILVESMELSKSVSVSELIFNSQTPSLGQRQIFADSELKYFLGTSKNISSNTQTDKLLLYSISVDASSSIFDPNYIPNINPPPLRKYYGIFLGKSEIYIYGGVSEIKVFNDFWRYDIKTGVWTDISHFFTKFNLPPLYEFGYISFRQYYYDDEDYYNYIIIAGGIDNKGKFIDKVWLFLYDERINEKIFQDGDLNSIAGCTKGPLAGIKIFNSMTNILHFFSGYRKENGTEGSYYMFDGICELRFDNTKKFNINQNFKIFKPATSSVALFNDYTVYQGKIFRYFGIEYTNSKIVYNTAVHSLDLQNIEKGWIMHADLKIKAHSFSIVRIMDYVYLVEGDASNSYQINYPLLNTTVALKNTENHQKQFILVRLGNDLYLYNSSFYKIQNHGGGQNSIVTIDEIKSFNEGPISDYYSYSREGDFLLIVEYIDEKRDKDGLQGNFENNERIKEYLRFWLFNIKSQEWHSYDDIYFLPYENDKICTIIKYPYILLVGRLYETKPNTTDPHEENQIYKILVFNTITQTYNIYNLEDYSGDLSFSCQVLNNYQDSTNFINSYIIELVVVSKQLQKTNEFFKIQKISISNPGITQSEYTENLKELRAPSYNYFLLDNDEIYFFDCNPGKVNNESDWWQSTNSSITNGEVRIVHNSYVSINNSYIEFLNNSLFVFSGTLIDKVTGLAKYSDHFYEYKLKKTSYIKSCDFGYQKVKGVCQPCDIGTYNDNKSKGYCVSCDTFLNKTSGVASWSFSQCTVLLNYASQTEENLIKEAFGVNLIKLQNENDQSYGFFSYLGIIIAILIAGLIIKILLIGFLLRLDYFQVNIEKKKNENNEIDLLNKIKNSVDPTINDTLYKNIKEQIEKKYNENNKYYKTEVFLTVLAFSLIIFITFSFFWGFYYIEELKIEEISILEYENKYEKIESKVKINIGIFPVNQKSCDLNLFSISSPKHLESSEFILNYLETENGGICIISLKANLTEASEEFWVRLESLHTKLYAKNIFYYVQSYNVESENPLSLYKTFQSSEGKNFANNVDLNLTLSHKILKEDYYFTMNITKYNKFDENSLSIIPEMISDRLLPLGSKIDFYFSINWSKNVEITTIELCSELDYKIFILLINIILIHYGLRACGLKILLGLESFTNSDKKKMN